MYTEKRHCLPQQHLKGCSQLLILDKFKPTLLYSAVFTKYIIQVWLLLTFQKDDCNPELNSFGFFCHYKTDLWTLI